MVNPEKLKISLAHSPDADDAFMFYALTEKLFPQNGFEVKSLLKDIQKLNEDSDVLKHDVQAISFFAYPFVEDNYQLLSCGGSLGIGYGPVVVGKEKITLDSLKKKTIAVPGEKTTAYLLLKLLLGDFKYEVVPFDEIFDKIKKGKYSYGLVIHEGQLTYKKHGLKKIVDLGEWWLGKTNLPVPLGGNVIKRSFSMKKKKEINSLLKKSIAYGLENKKRILPYISKYARELKSSHQLVNKFVSMYVNEFTLDYGIVGKLAIRKLFKMAFEEKLIDKMPRLDFVQFI